MAESEYNDKLKLKDYIAGPANDPPAYSEKADGPSHPPQRFESQRSGFEASGFSSFDQQYPSPSRGYPNAQDLPSQGYPYTQNVPSRGYPNAQNVPSRGYPNAQNVPSRGYPNAQNVAYPQQFSTTVSVCAANPVVMTQPRPQTAQDAMVDPEDIKDYMPFAIISLFFCLCCGIMAVLQASNAKSKKASGKYFEAKHDSKNALALSITAVIFGIIFSGIYTTLHLLVIANQE